MFSLKKGLAGLAVALFCFQAAGDVIDPNTHVVDRCVIVTNLSDFPDIVLVGAYISPGKTVQGRYVVKNDSCMTKGYRFNSFYLFWVVKSYFNSVGIDALPLDNLISALLPKKTIQTDAMVPVREMIGLFSSKINPYGGVVPDENPVVREVIEYKIKVTTTLPWGVILVLDKTTSFTKSGDSTVVEGNPISSVTGLIKKSENTSGISNVQLVRGCLMFLSNGKEKINGTLIDCGGRIVKKFEREADAGKVYTVPCAGISQGVYLLQIKHNSLNMTVQVMNTGTY